MDVEYFRYLLEENTNKIAFSFNRFITIEIWKSDIIIRVDKGGSTGGNCWDGVSEAYSGYSGSPTYDILLAILQPIYNNITDSILRKIIEACGCSSINDEAYSDYYGNYSIIEKITIDIDKLIMYLIDIKFITD